MSFESNIGKSLSALPESAAESEQRLATLLATRPANDPERQAALREWCQGQEHWVNMPSDLRDGHKVKQLELNRRTGRLWLMAGMFDDARECFEDALWQARAEGKDEVAESILREMDEKKL